MVPLKGPEHGHVAGMSAGDDASLTTLLPQHRGQACPVLSTTTCTSILPCGQSQPGRRGLLSPRGGGPSPEPPGSRTQLLHRPETADPARGSSDTSSWFPASFPPPVSPGLPQWRALSQEHKAAFALSPGERLHGDAADWPSSVLQQLGGVGLRGTAPRPSASQGKRECKHSAHLGRKRGKHSPGPRWTGSFQADS